MATRFRKSKTIAPGVKLNLSKKSVGVSIGGKGVHYSVNSSGRKTVSAGIPGSGLSFVKSSGGSTRSKHVYSSNSSNSVSAKSGSVQSAYDTYTNKGYSFIEDGVVFPGKEVPTSVNKIKTYKTIFLILGLLLSLLSFFIMPFGIVTLIIGILSLCFSSLYSELVKSYNQFKSLSISE